MPTTMRRGSLRTLRARSSTDSGKVAEYSARTCRQQNLFTGLALRKISTYAGAWLNAHTQPPTLTQKMLRHALRVPAQHTTGQA